MNLAPEAVDRHVEEGRGEAIALRCVAEDGGVREFSYARLRDHAARFANVLSDLGIRRGDRVMTMLGRQAEQYVAALGTVHSAH